METKLEHNIAILKQCCRDVFNMCQDFYAGMDYDIMERIQEAFNNLEE